MLLLLFSESSPGSGLLVVVGQVILILLSWEPGPCLSSTVALACKGWFQVLEQHKGLEGIPCLPSWS